MTRYEVMKIILNLIEDDTLALFTTGMTSREAFFTKDRESNFYMIGSMGLLSPVGLGIAMNRPDKKLLVFDGDGSALMNLGSLAMIGDLQPKNLYHIILDNEAYASTGGQPSISRTVKLEEIAKAVNYKNTYKVISLEELESKLREMLGKDGPSILLAKIGASNMQGIGRVSHSPEEIKNRFTGAIAEMVRKS